MSVTAASTSILHIDLPNVAGHQPRYPLTALQEASIISWLFGLPQMVRAEVVKLVDTHVSGTCEATRGGSSPLLGTIQESLPCCFPSFTTSLVNNPQVSCLEGFMTYLLP